MPVETAEKNGSVTRKKLSYDPNQIINSQQMVNTQVILQNQSDKKFIIMGEMIASPEFIYIDGDGIGFMAGASPAQYLMAEPGIIGSPCLVDNYNPLAVVHGFDVGLDLWLTPAVPNYTTTRPVPLAGGFVQRVGLVVSDEEIEPQIGQAWKVY